MSDYETIERIARQMCEERWGEGRWNGRGTKRNYWRRKARNLLATRDASSDPKLMTRLMRIVGWQV